MDRLIKVSFDATGLDRKTRPVEVRYVQQKTGTHIVRQKVNPQRHSSIDLILLHCVMNGFSSWNSDIGIAEALEAIENNR